MNHRTQRATQRVPGLTGPTVYGEKPGSVIPKLLLTSTVCAVLAFAGATSADAKEWKEDWDNDGNPDHVFLDEDDDGNPEYCDVLAKDGTVVAMWEDLDDDGDWDRYWVGKHTDGEFHVYYEDVDRDGKFDQVWVDGGRTNDANPYNVFDGRIGKGELYAWDPEPVPTEPRPRNGAAPDCTGDPECDGGEVPLLLPDIWVEDLIPPGFPDGIPDHWFSDADGDVTPDWAARDQDQDGVPEDSFLDRDGDGFWDFWWWDSNLDGQWDNYKRDSDGDLQFDLWWTDENVDGKIQAAEVITIAPEPLSPDPIPQGSLFFCAGGPECPDFGLYFIDPEDYAHHNRGSLRLTVTDQGTLGYMDDTQEKGSGLTYPSETNQTNHLYVGSLWVSEGNAGVKSKGHAADPEQSWVFSIDPDGHLSRSYDGNSDQDFGAGFNDDDSNDPFGFYIRQESWAFDSGSDDDDFVIVRYFIHNRSDDQKDDLRVGLFLDLDLEGTSIDDEGGTDAGTKSAYLVDPTSGVHIGASILEGDQSTASNLSLLHNPTYFWPTLYVPPLDKLGFLRGDPGYVVPSSTGPDDYSLLLSVGPFSLAPLDSSEVTFAIAGGPDLPSLLDSFNRARTKHNPAASVDDYESIVGTTRLVSTPNPFSANTTIRYLVPRNGPVTLTVYDTRGRLVRTLAQGHHERGTWRVHWDGLDGSGRRVGNGVYFVNLNVAGESSSRRVTVVR